MSEDNKPLYSRYNYIIPDVMVSYKYLVEYDIRHANISMLKATGLIDDQLYAYFENVPKRDREVAIGVMISSEKKESYEEVGTRFSKTEDAIKSGILEAKRQFVESNGIVDDQIVRIANDALLVKCQMELPNRIFNIANSQVEFKIDGVYTSMVKVADCILLFNSDNCAVEVKGISNDKLYLCQDFLTAICEIILYIEKGDLKVAKMKFHEFYKDYITLALPLNFYRELNAGTGFRLKYDGILTVPKTTRILALESEFDKSKLDISYNLYILRNLYNIILSLSV